MRYASVCSGVEAASLAWGKLGWKPVWFSEIEPFPCAVLKERFPDVPNLGDMTQIKGADYCGKLDILVGGTPCQGFSVAGKQGGLKDERSVLCLTYVRLLKEMRPRWFVWENVPGVFSTNGGEDFKSFIRAVNEIGYCCAWRVLDAQYVRVDGFPRAVPQRRRRVFVVGHIGGDWRYPAKVLFEREGMSGNPAPCRTKGKGFTTDVERSVGASGMFWNGNNYAESLTCTSDRQLMPDKARLQCVICRANDNGNAECGYDVATTLKASNQNCPPIINDQGGNEQSVCSAFLGNAGVEADIAYVENITPTLRASAIPDVITCNSRQMGLDIRREHCGTLIATDYKEPQVVCYENHASDSRVKETGECCQTLSSRAGTGGGNLPLVQDCHSVAVAENATVRRLLPVECERLMGFPDNWTRIPWRGKPEEDCPDSHRYKACGNSMCVNVMRWIGMRIEMVEKESRKERTNADQ